MTQDISALYNRHALAPTVANTNTLPADTRGQGQPDADHNPMAKLFYPSSSASGMPPAPVGPAVATIASTFAPPAGWVDVPGHAAVRRQIAERIHSLGLHPSYAAELADLYRESAVRPITTSPAVALAELRSAWGDQTDVRLGKIKAEIGRIPGLKDVLNETGLGNSASLAKTIWRGIEAARA